VARSGRVARGIEELREVYRITFANKPTIKVDIGKIIPAGEDLALIVRTWRSTAETSAGKSQDWSGVYTDIVRRQLDGTWKLVLDNPNGLEISEKSAR
jgi:ketosteroid isomerase-like protein